MERLFFSQLLNVHKDNDVGEIEIQTAEPIILDPTLLEFEIAIEKLKKYKNEGNRSNWNFCRIQHNLIGIIITTKDVRLVVHLETRKLSEIETNSKNKILEIYIKE